MRFVTYEQNGAERVGVMAAGGDKVVPIAELGFAAGDMNEFIRELNGKSIPEKALMGKNSVSLNEIKLLAPIPRPERDVVCLGLNYREHAAEAAKADQGYDQQRGDAVYFSKRVDTAVAPGDNINGHFDICSQLDYEAELAVVIGRDANHVKAENAREYIFGYTILNDVSARNLQLKHKQWYFGKSLDGFTPIGPCIVTADEFETYPPRLGIRSFVNGEKRQDSNTGLQIFDIDHVIAELSQGMTLKAGTLIATGTPAGVGMGMDPPQFLVPGDVVRCEIDGIGTLTNPVR